MEAQLLQRQRLAPRLRIPRASGGDAVLVGLGCVSLAALAAGVLALTLGAATHPGPLSPANHSRLPEWIAGPLAGDGTRIGSGGVVAILGAMVLAYAGALAVVRRLPRRVILGAIGALYAILLIAPPLLSADIFSYVAYARMGALHGVDPYAHGPWAISHDPVFAFTHWRATPSVYGPLFTVLSYGLALLGLTFALWSLKTLAILAALGTIWLVAATTRLRGQDPWFPAALVAFNPVMLVYAAGGGHNDLIMGLLAVAAVHLQLSGRSGRAGVATVGSVAIKASSAVVIPFLWLGSRGAQRRGLELGGLAAAAAVGAMAVAVFGSHAAGFAHTLAGQHDLASVSSWPVTLDMFIGPGTDLRTTARIVALVVLVGLVVQTWRGRLDWIAGAGWALLVVGVTSPWLLAWYTTWPLPFAAISRDRRLIAATLFAQLLFLAHRIPAIVG